MSDAIDLRDEEYEVIISHYTNEKLSELSEEQLQLLKRWRVGVDILKKNPIREKAALKLHELYPEISLLQAEFDIDKSKKLFILLNSYDTPFLNFFLIENLISVISSNTSKNIRNKNLKTLKRELKNYPEYLKSKNMSMEDFLKQFDK